MTLIAADRVKQTSHDAVAAQHELLIAAWESVLAGSSAVYLSGPITTGPRFVDWFRRTGRSLMGDSNAYRAAMRANVIEPNSRDLQRAAVQLRAALHEPVLEPASLFVAEWTQDDYLSLWARVIEKFAARIVMMPGWEFSAGCAAELHRAFAHRLPVTTLDGAALSLERAAQLLHGAAAELASENIPIANLSGVAGALAEFGQSQTRSVVVSSESNPLRKDASLDRLADLINVAQFVSFSPSAKGPHQEYCRILGLEPNSRFKSVRHAIGTLLEHSSENSINLRSYTPESPQSREFIYGIRSVEEALGAAERLSSEGLFVIANETVDVRDGGVSGVVMGDVIEFTPDDTPRGVEKPGIASLPRLWGMGMLSAVYGFEPDINVPRASRLEFSLHPKPRGWRHTHTLGWEYSTSNIPEGKAKISWPNRFSRMIGDKVYGLLVGHLAGLPVPETTVINRRIAPFKFGRPTGSSEVWLRTSPREQVPGKFTTVKGWIDPFDLLQVEDNEDHQIASVLCQRAVPSIYAGAAIVSADDRLIIEGKAGEGDTLMKGSSHPEPLPASVRRAVHDLYERVNHILGRVRFEWVFDGSSVWIVQLHRGATQSTSDVLVPGEADHWVLFDAGLGLEELRSTVHELPPGAGLLLKGEVGLTSHVADVIRRAGIPARFWKAE